ncbi:MAG: TRAP transporter large permease subunit [Gammaproteobacteria bacterium]|jgi:C4-dicarboxylate transporter DctM subunit|nr:TRAP transporter large permease subunit [Gammaproteobacteria bacterium]|tara:strand:+ start:872 stop:2188 length:1317 start_codon:yes stop_codon:yes gene_type:complete
MFNVEWYQSGPATLLILLVFIFLGVPVAFSMLLAGVVGLVMFSHLAFVSQAAAVFYAQGSEYTFIVVPLFVLMASLIANSGAATAVFSATSKWFGRVPGSLALGSTTAATLFSAVSGSSPATAASVGLMAVPEMVRQGYDKRLATGSVAAGGTLGILIPPSIPLIVYGGITETSIGKLFLAGLVPGVVISAILLAYTLLWSLLKPAHAPSLAGVAWSDRLRSLWDVWPIVFLLFLVMGSFYAGIATIAEAAAVGVLGAFAIAAMNRALSFRILRKSLIQACTTSAMILFLIAGGSFLAFVMAVLKVPQGLTDYFLGLGLSGWWLVAGYVLLLLAVGCIAETLAAVLIFIPIVSPVFIGLGFDPLWIGVVTIIAVEVGAITPPVGLNIFVLRGILEKQLVTTNEIYAGCAAYVPALLIGLALAMAFPSLSTWLPNMAIR